MLPRLRGDRRLSRSRHFESRVADAMPRCVRYRRLADGVRICDGSASQPIALRRRLTTMRNMQFTIVGLVCAAVLTACSAATADDPRPGGSSDDRVLAMARSIAEATEADQEDAQITSVSMLVRPGRVARSESNVGRPCGSGRLIEVKLIGDFPHIVTAGRPVKPGEHVDFTAHALVVTADARTGKVCREGCRPGRSHPSQARPRSRCADSAPDLPRDPRRTVVTQAIGLCVSIACDRVQASLGPRRSEGHEGPARFLCAFHGEPGCSKLVGLRGGRADRTSPRNVGRRPGIRTTHCSGLRRLDLPATDDRADDHAQPRDGIRHDHVLRGTSGYSSSFGNSRMMA